MAGPPPTFIQRQLMGELRASLAERHQDKANEQVNRNNCPAAAAEEDLKHENDGDTDELGKRKTMKAALRKVFHKVHDLTHYQSEDLSNHLEPETKLSTKVERIEINSSFISELKDTKVSNVERSEINSSFPSKLKDTKVSNVERSEINSSFPSELKDTKVSNVERSEINSSLFLKLKDRKVSDVLDVLSLKIYRCQITKYKVKRHEKKFLVYDSQPLAELGERCSLRICINTSNLGEGRGISIQFLRFNSIKAQGSPNMCLRYRRSFIIKGKGQYGMKSTKDIIFEDEPPFGDDWANKWYQEFYHKPKFISHDVLINGNYSGSEDTIEICCILEPLFPLIIMFSSNNGVLVWTVENAFEALNDEVRGVSTCLQSPYFYSAPYGYRLRCRLYLNGNSLATGKFVSVFMDFLKGEFDSFLPDLCQFPHTTTFAIVDQAGDQRCRNDYVKSEVNSDGFISDFIYDLIPLYTLFSSDSPYIKENSFTLKVTINPLKTQDQQNKMSSL